MDYSKQQHTIDRTIENRNYSVQIFRALAIIAVVLGHTLPSGYWQVFCRPYINIVVATFLFLSGYLTKSTNDNWAAFYKKRIIRVIIPYIIWTVLYTLECHTISQLPFLLVSATAAGHLYYIFVYIQFVLLTPLIGKLATSRYQALGWFIAPVSLIVFKYYWLLTGQNLNPIIYLLWDNSFLGWFTFYYLGLILGNRIMEKHYSMKVLVVLFLAASVLQMAEGYGWLMLGEANCGTQLKLSALLTNSIFVLIIYTVFQNGKIVIKNKFLRMIGDYSFGIYLCHVLIKHLLGRFVPLYASIPFPITSAIVLLLSLCFCYYGEKICGKKVSKWLGLK